MTSGWSPSFGEYIDTTVAVSDQSRGPAVSKSAVGNYVLNGTIYVGQYVTHKESVDGLRYVLQYGNRKRAAIPIASISKTNDPISDTPPPRGSY